MKWWNDMSHSEKGFYMEGEFKHRHPQSLTGREIEMLFDDKCKFDAEIIEMAFSNENKSGMTFNEALKQIAKKK